MTLKVKVIQMYLEECYGWHWTDSVFFEDYLVIIIIINSQAAPDNYFSILAYTS